MNLRTARKLGKAMSDDIRTRIAAAERRLKQEQADANRDAARALTALLREAFPTLPPGDPGEKGSE